MGDNLKKTVPDQMERMRIRMERLKNRELVITESMMRAIHDNSEWSHSGDLRCKLPRNPR